MCALDGEDAHRKFLKAADNCNWQRVEDRGKNFPLQFCRRIMDARNFLT